MKRRRIANVLLMTFLIVGGSAVAQKKKEVVNFGDPKGTIYDMAFLQEGSALAVAEGSTVRIYDVNDQNLITEFTGGHSDVILSIDVSSDDTKFISSGRDGIICVWDLENQILIEQLDYHEGAITSVKFSPDNNYILSGGTDNQIVLYDLKQNKVRSQIPGHTDDILSVDFHPNGVMFASAGADEKIKFWNIHKATPIATINSLKGWPRDISFSPDSTRLLSCGDDSDVSIWDISNLNNIRLINKIDEPGGWCLTHDLQQNGNTLVSGGMDGRIRINFSFGRYFYKVNKPITKVIFVPNRPDLKMVAATMGGGVIMLNASNMKLRQR